jgi:hypothetical protein
MKSIKLKTLLCVAGVLGVSALGVSVQAQGTSLLSVGTTNWQDNGPRTYVSTYSFSGSMIVNSVGFYTNGSTPTLLGWARGDGSFANITNQTYTFTDGWRWYNINETFTNGSSLKLKTEFSSVTNYVDLLNQTPGLNVNLSSLTVNNNEQYVGNNEPYINTNIRVSNPGSNIAPEPGTFALALTGGAALAGVGLRRRRRAS